MINHVPTPHSPSGCPMKLYSSIHWLQWDLQQQRKKYLCTWGQHLYSQQICGMAKKYEKWHTGKIICCVVALNDTDVFFFFSQLAPGKVSTTSDGWTAEAMKKRFLGVTAHWIQVKDRIWETWLELVGYKPVVGKYLGANLARYFIGVCDCVGIWTPEQSKASR